jgi:hypothetical protein
MQQENEGFINPIDKDKITDTPGTLPYAHHVGSGLVKPIDEGKVKGRAVAAMHHQTDQQLGQLYEQMQLLNEQAKRIQKRVEISEKIYLAEMRFEPLINHTYHLYLKDDGKNTLSMIGPNQWGKKGCPYQFEASVKLLADHTWEILE